MEGKDIYNVPRSHSALIESYRIITTDLDAYMIRSLQISDQFFSKFVGIYLFLYILDRLSAALELAERGFKVDIYDRQVSSPPSFPIDLVLRSLKIFLFIQSEILYNKFFFIWS